MVPSPEQRRAVQGVRIFLPLYALGTLLLALPVVLRAEGIDWPAASELGSAVLIAMAIAAPSFLAWLAGRGEYSTRGGLKFRLVPALARGDYVPIAAAAATSRLDSPLGAIALDARAVAADLTTAGLQSLAEIVQAVVAEGEILRLACTRVGQPEASAVAEPLLGQLQDRVTQLKNGARIDPDALALELEVLLHALRAGNDQLRRLPGR